MLKIAPRLFFALAASSMLIACGGDDDNNPNPSPTATPTATPTGTPTATPTPSPTPIAAGCATPVADNIVAAFDDHTFDDIFAPALAIDDDLSNLSRWSSAGDGKWIFFDLGSAKSVREVHTAWYKGDERITTFDLESSLDATNWTLIEAGILSQGSTQLESNVIPSTDARFIRLVGHRNSDSEWNSLLEIDILTCGETGTATIDPVAIPTPTPIPSVSTPASTPVAPLTIGTLDSAMPPGSNFDLLSWNISIPTDTDNSGTADTISETALNGGYEDSNYLYTADDGGMVFRAPLAGFKTSENTSYTRTELRGMLRRGNTSISTRGVNQNNWVFSSAPIEDQTAARATDGNLRATLAVNHVDTTSISNQVGRVIIGQIHANDDEPLRLYYRKLPNNTLGSIYFAHEILNGDDTNYELIGSRNSSAANPADGIALDEVFSYEIDVQGHLLTVSILREGKPDVTQTISMENSGYDQGGQFMFFKAGVYNQAIDGGDPDDYTQATFYALEATHN